MKPTALALAALLLIPALAGTAMAAAAASPRAAKAPGVNWRSWDRGLEEAKASGRPVLVDVYTDWCGWCRRMDADVYSRPEVLDYLSRTFVSVKLDAEAPDAASYDGRAFTSRSLAAHFSVSGYPTTIFLRPAGDHLVNVPGYVAADRFLLLLHYIGDGEMDRGISFQDFVKRSAAGGAERH